MERVDLMKTVRSYHLDPEDFIISGSGPLCILFPDLFRSTDVDLIVSERAFQDLSHRSGWHVECPPSGVSRHETRLVCDDGCTECFCAWKLGEKYIPFSELKRRASSYEKLLLMPLWLVRLYKLVLHRPKDNSALSFLEAPALINRGAREHIQQFVRIQ